MGHSVVHFEVGATDDEPLVEFYGELFGWRLQAFTGADYTMIDTCAGVGINGGVSKSQTGKPWLTFYVETEDPQATLDKANALGGSTVLPITDFGGALTIAMFSDPDGLLIGLVRSPSEPGQGGGPGQSGGESGPSADSAPSPGTGQAGPSPGSGAGVSWFEIMGADPARSQQFYAELFGWKIDSTTFPAYGTVDPGAGRGIQGGIGGGLETRWATVYVQVRDIEQTFSRAEALGGSRVTDSGVPELKTVSRAALYGAAGGKMVTGAVRDPAGNVIGLSRKG